MDKGKFEDGLTRIYAIFGKKAPDNPDVVCAILERVGSLPNGFMDYAIEKLQDMEKLPANIGKFLKVDLWPEYLSENPQLRASASFECPECRGTGYIHAFRTDEGTYKGVREAFDCQCRIGDQGWTREKIMGTSRYGFTDIALQEANKERFGRIRDKYLGTIGRQEEVRKEHKEYLDDWVEVET